MWLWVELGGGRGVGDVGASALSSPDYRHARTCAATIRPTPPGSNALHKASHTSRDTCHTSHSTRHTSHVTRHTIHVNMRVSSVTIDHAHLLLCLKRHQAQLQHACHMSLHCITCHIIASHVISFACVTCHIITSRINCMQLAYSIGQRLD